MLACIRNLNKRYCQSIKRHTKEIFRSSIEQARKSGSAVAKKRSSENRRGVKVTWNFLQKWLGAKLDSTKNGGTEGKSPHRTDCKKK